MHSIPKQVRSLEIGDHFVMDPDQYFFATRYKVISKDERGLVAQIVYRYPPEEGEHRPNDNDDNNGWGKMRIAFEHHPWSLGRPAPLVDEKEFMADYLKPMEFDEDTDRSSNYEAFKEKYGTIVYTEDPLWCAFRDKRLPKEQIQ